MNKKTDEVVEQIIYQRGLELFDELGGLKNHLNVEENKRVLFIIQRKIERAIKESEQSANEQLSEKERQIVLLEKQVERLEDELKELKEINDLPIAVMKRISDKHPQGNFDKVQYEYASRLEIEYNHIKQQHNSLIAELRNVPVYGAVMVFGGDEKSKLTPSIKESDVQSIINKYKGE